MITISKCMLLWPCFVEGLVEIMREQDDKFIDEILSQIEMPNECLNRNLNVH